MAEEAVVDAPIKDEPKAPADPFALEESQLASLSPEQRASLDPILDGWKKKASEQIESTRKTASEESAKPYREKAEALDNLVKHPAFVSWWNQQQQQAMQGQTAQTQEQISQARPQDFATPEEWSQAVIDASNGNPQKLQQIQARGFAMLATPVVQKLHQEVSTLKTQNEMNALMKNHPDYEELDQIGLDDKGEGTSLLEHCINWAENNGRPLEEGYQMARRWSDAMASGAKAKAMGLVKDKKDSVTAGPSTQIGGETVVYVRDQDELIRKSMQAELDGKKGIRFEIQKT